jgi:hypothetical protein
MWLINVLYLEGEKMLKPIFKNTIIFQFEVL